jgi:hypothetical protein
LIAGPDRRLRRGLFEGRPARSEPAREIIRPAEFRDRAVVHYRRRALAPSRRHLTMLRPRRTRGRAFGLWRAGCPLCPWEEHLSLRGEQLPRMGLYVAFALNTSAMIEAAMVAGPCSRSRRPISRGPRTARSTTATCCPRTAGSARHADSRRCPRALRGILQADTRTEITGHRHRPRTGGGRAPRRAAAGSG